MTGKATCETFGHRMRTPWPPKRPHINLLLSLQETDCTKRRAQMLTLNLKSTSKRIVRCPFLGTFAAYAKRIRAARRRKKTAEGDKGKTGEEEGSQGRSALINVVYIYRVLKRGPRGPPASAREPPCKAKIHARGRRKIKQLRAKSRRKSARCVPLPKNASRRTTAPASGRARPGRPEEVEAAAQP